MDPTSISCDPHPEVVLMRIDPDLLNSIAHPLGVDFHLFSSL